MRKLRLKEVMGQARSHSEPVVESKLGLCREVSVFLLPTLGTSLPGCWSDGTPLG